MTKKNLHSLPAFKMIAAYRSGELSPVEVAESVIDYISLSEPKLHAMYAFDPEGALKAAAESEARWHAGTPLTCGGVTLDGVPATVKENIATTGVPIPLGTAAVDLEPAMQDGPPAARLREAGAVLLGKTTMPDYGMLSSGLSSFHELARNPWNTEMNPGGSSAGAGSASAAGYGPLHVGTDIGGSVRLPASWCGVIGLKPTYGRVPMDPPYMARAAGPMTRTVEDAALMMSVMSQPDHRDYTSVAPVAVDWMNLDRSVKGLRIGLLLDSGCGMPTDPQVRAAVAAAAKAFEEAGAKVEPMDPWMTNGLLDGVDTFWRLRSAIDVRALSEEKRNKILPVVREWAETGLGLSGETAFEAYTATVKVRASTVLATHPYDYVLSPVSPNASFPASWPHPMNSVKHAMYHIGFTVPFSMSEQPAISVNCGFDGNGVPIGLQIAGKRFDDIGVLQMAKAFETLRPMDRDWPDFSV